MPKISRELLEALSPKERENIARVKEIVKTVLGIIEARFPDEKKSVIAMGLGSTFVSFVESIDCDHCKAKAYTGFHSALTERMLTAVYNSGVDAGLEGAEEDNDNAAPEEKPSHVH